MKLKYLAGTVVPALIVAVMSSCSGRTEAAAEEITCHLDTVTVSAGSPVLSKLIIEEALEEPFSSEFRTVGTVQAETGRFAEVCPPFDGRIMNSSVRLGRRVRAGETLFEMSSPDFLESSKVYFQNVRNYEKAKADQERQAYLHEAGIISQKELSEAAVAAENARQEMDASAAALRVYGVDPSDLKLGQPLKVTAPISGEVAFNRVTPGSFVRTDSEPLVTIADLGRVWVTALVKERFIGVVSKGGSVEIFTEADPDKPVFGTILNVGNLVDEETRSVQVVVSCDNSDMKLKHGMYVSVHFLSEPVNTVVLPSTAVFQGETSSFVYVCTDSDLSFVKRNVVVGQSSDDNTRICIENGLEPGEKVLVEGGLYLND